MREEYDFSKAKLVIPPQDPRKTRITIRLDTKILKWFWQRVDEAGGGNYQTMINEVLKRHIESEEKKSLDYPGGPHLELDGKYRRDCEADGLEFEASGYDFVSEIREMRCARRKAA